MSKQETKRGTTMTNETYEYDPLNVDYSDYEHGQDLDVEMIGPGHPDYERIKALFEAKKKVAA